MPFPSFHMVFQMVKRGNWDTSPFLNECVIHNKRGGAQNGLERKGQVSMIYESANF